MPSIFKLFHRSLILLILLYFYMQVTQKTISISLNESLLTTYIIPYIPHSIYHILFFMLIAFIILSLNYQSITMTMLYAALASFVFTSSFLFMESYLEMNSYTQLYFFTLYHPIPLEQKYNFLTLTLTELLNKFELHGNTLQKLQEELPNVFNEETLQHLNASQITQRARALLLETSSSVAQSSNNFIMTLFVFLNFLLFKFHA